MGGWWWTGGFGIKSSAAGPPYRTLSEWKTEFESIDQNKFSEAMVVTLAVGVGSYNPDVTSFVDSINFEFDGYKLKLADFEPAIERRSYRTRRVQTSSNKIQLIYKINIGYVDDDAAASAAASVNVGGLAAVAAPITATTTADNAVAIGDACAPTCAPIVTSKPGCYVGVVRTNCGKIV